MRVATAEIGEPELTELFCYLCGRFMAMIGRDYNGPKAHGICEAQLILNNAVPNWPDTPETRARIVEWERAYPGLPWRERFHMIPPARAGASRPPEERSGPYRMFRVRCQAPRCVYTVNVESLSFLADRVRQHVRENPGHHFGYTRL